MGLFGSKDEIEDVLRRPAYPPSMVERPVALKPQPQQQQPQYEAVHPLNYLLRVIDSLQYRHMKTLGNELVIIAKQRGLVMKNEDGTTRDVTWNDLAELIHIWSEAPPVQKPDLS